MENQTEIRIYVADLAAYNSGILHGAWIAAARDAWEIYDDIAAMLKTSPIPEAEEWAIHDYEGFEGVRIEEYEGLESIAEKAAFIIEHGALGGAVMSYYGDLEEARAALAERYAGEYASLSDFAQERTEQSVAIPDPLRFYIDYDRMARDMEIDDVMVIETGFEHVHVFWSR